MRHQFSHRYLLLFSQYYSCKKIKNHFLLFISKSFCKICIQISLTHKKRRKNVCTKFYIGIVHIRTRCRSVSSWYFFLVKSITFIYEKPEDVNSGFFLFIPDPLQKTRIDMLVEHQRFFMSCIFYMTFIVN